MTDPIDELAAKRRGSTKKRPSSGPLKHFSFKDAEAKLANRSLVKGWLNRSELSLIFGAKGCRKTFFTLDLACHVACNRFWGGVRVYPGLVVYVAVEAGASIANRIVAFRKYHKLEGVDVPFEAVTSPVDLCHLNTGDVITLGKLIREASKKFGQAPVLVVIDTVNRALAGGDENSPDDMGAFVAAMGLLREHLDCHVCGVHHNGKDKARGARGHTSLECAVDTSIEIEKLDGISVATIRHQRDGIEGMRRAFRLKAIDLGFDEDDEPATSCVVEWTDAPAEAVELTQTQKLAVETLTKALKEHGTDDLLNGCVSVSLDVWRKEFVGRMTAEGRTDGAITRAWQRV